MAELTALNTIHNMDAMGFTSGLPDNFVQCVVTSPPYFDLRSYLGPGDANKQAEIGGEETLQGYLWRMATLFWQVYRALRPDGTLWLNLGDSYTRNKSLMGIPWRVAFALQDQGWILRSEIIWHKPNCMPESVKDRPTKAHETVFLFSKSQSYYYNAEAVLEPSITDDRRSPRGSKGNARPNSGNRKAFRGGGAYTNGNSYNNDAQKENAVQGNNNIPNEYRNRRTVWSIPTAPAPFAHFATFPPALIEPMILAGSPRGGIVLDPFMGSGTTAIVARMLGRAYIGCELNSEYVQLAEERLAVPSQVRLFA